MFVSRAGKRRAARYACASGARHRWCNEGPAGPACVLGVSLSLFIFLCSPFRCFVARPAAPSSPMVRFFFGVNDVLFFVSRGRGQQRRPARIRFHRLFSTKAEILGPLMCVGASVLCVFFPRNLLLRLKIAGGGSLFSFAACSTYDRDLGVVFRRDRRLGVTNSLYLEVVAQGAGGQSASLLRVSVLSKLSHSRESFLGCSKAHQQQ